MAEKDAQEVNYQVFSEILEELNGNKYFKGIKTHLDNVSGDSKGADKQDQAERFLSWARRESNLKVVNADVPSGILPNDYEGLLHDVKVFVKYGPDDKVYDNNKIIRDRVARGNCFLQLTNKAPRTFCVLQAMKKFTGGLGDDDDRETGDMTVWQRYFTKPLEETEVVIATSKANGEAAHLSCIEIDGQFVLCGGSKNVHLLFRNKADIAKYVEPRYRIATEVCETVMQFLDAMEPKIKRRLLSFLVVSGYTAVFEILSPLHQHVVNLSHLKSPELKFITWTKCELEPSEKLQHLNIVPPHVGIEIAKCLGLDAVHYSLLKMEGLNDHMKKIRQGFNEEGAVLYFMDKENQVIGLLKKKTAWYIICRAIREKLKVAVRQSTQNPDNYSKSRSLKQISKRIYEIQTWLNLDKQTVDDWIDLGSHCLEWVLAQVDDGAIQISDIQDMFPVVWKKFLSENQLTDRISFQETSTEGASGS